jgi:hypothetical protein
MSIESTADWEGLKRAARVARITLDALAAQVRPGVTTALRTADGSLSAHHEPPDEAWR